MNISRLLAVLACLTACGCASGSKSVIEHEVIYRIEDGNLLEVYNLEKLWISNEGVSYLKRRDARYGEFGGSFQICSNDEYYCVIGGVAAAIPRKFSGQTSWEFGGLSCSAASPLVEGQTANITCNLGNFKNELTYSQSLGIVAYTLWVVSIERYKVVGDKGLFAQPQASDAAHSQSP